MKWSNAREVTVLEILFILIETPDERHACCVCNVNKQNRASAPFIQRRAEHAGFIFKSTFAA